EALIRASGINATILRPWYVLGPGHWWPYALVPVYGILRLIPSTAEGARRLGLVTRAQMIRALVHAVEQPPVGVKIVEVPEIGRTLEARQRSSSGSLDTTAAEIARRPRSHPQRSIGQRRGDEQFGNGDAHRGLDAVTLRQHGGGRQVDPRSPHVGTHPPRTAG